VAGLAGLAAAAGPVRLERRLVLAALVPASLAIGNMYDFFMTRYMLVAVIPLTDLGLGVADLPDPSSGCVALPLRLAPAAVVLGLALAGRTQLIRVVEYRGLIASLQSLAEPIRKEGGILLFEYPKLALRFEPLLRTSGAGR